MLATSLLALAAAACALAAPAPAPTPANHLAPRQSSGGYPQPPNGAHREFYVANSPLRLVLNYTGNAKPNFRKPPDGTAVILSDRELASSSSYIWSTWRATNGWKGVVKQFDSEEMCLDVGHGPRVGSKVKVWYCHGAAWQQFEVDNFQLKVAGTNLCVGYASATDKTQAVLVNCGEASSDWNEISNKPRRYTPPSTSLSTESPTPTSPGPSPTTTKTSLPTPSGYAVREFYAPDSPFRLALNYFRPQEPIHRPADGTEVQIRTSLWENDDPPRYQYYRWQAADGWRGVIKAYDIVEMCLDAGPDPGLYSKIVLNDCVGGASQTWMLHRSKIQLADTGFCVGIVNKQDGYQAELLSCQDEARTNWNRAAYQPVIPLSSSSNPPPSSTSRQPPLSTTFPQPSDGAHREFYKPDGPYRLALDYVGVEGSWRRPPDGTAVQLRDGEFRDGHPTTKYTWSTWRASEGWRGVIKQYDSDEMCLDAGPNPIYGSYIVVNPCNGGASQTWEVGQFNIQLVNTGLCVGFQDGYRPEGYGAILRSCQDPRTSWNGDPKKPFQYVPPWRTSTSSSLSVTATSQPPPSSSSNLPPSTSVPPPSTSVPPPSTSVPPPSSSQSPQPSRTTTTSLPHPSGDAHREFYASDSTLRLALDYPDNPELFNTPPDGTAVNLRDSAGDYKWATWRAADGWRGVIKNWRWSDVCLDAGPDPKLGSTMAINRCVGGASQTWVVSRSKIQLADTGLCVGYLTKGYAYPAELVSCQDNASTNWNEAPVNPSSSSSTPPPSSTVPPTSLTSSYPQPSGGAHREFYAPDTPFRLALDYTGGAPNFRRPPDGTKVQARNGNFDSSGHPTTSYRWSTWRAVDGWRGVIKQYDTDEMCLDAGPNPTLNSKIVANGCRGGASQTWLVSGSKIQLADTGFCVGLVNKQEGYQAELLSCQDNARTNWNQRPNQPVNPISSSASPSATSYSPTPQPTPSGSLPPPTSLPPPSSSVPPPSSSQSPQPSSTTTTGFPQPSGGAHREFYVYNSPFRLALNYTGGGNPRKPPDGTAVIYADGKFVDGRPTTQYTRTTFRATDGWRGVVKQYDSDEMCLDVGHGPRLGSRVKVWYCHGAAWQQFWVTKWKLQVANTNLCVGWESYPQEGLQATLIDCSRISTSFNQGPNQKWHA